MATISKKKAIEALDEWGSVMRQKTALEAERDEKLKPMAARYQKACQPVNDEYNPQLEPLNARAAELATQLTEFMEGGINRETNEVKLQLLEGEADEGLYPVIEVQAKSARTIAARAFFEKVTERTQDFFDCLTVGIAKAEAWLGTKAVDAMADSKTSFQIKLAMKKAKEAKAAKA